MPEIFSFENYIVLYSYISFVYVIVCFRRTNEPIGPQQLNVHFLMHLNF